MRSVPAAVVRAEGTREADPVSSPCWTPPCPHRLGVSPLSVAENEGCLAVPDAVPDAEGGASCGGGQDGEITMAFDCFNACPFIREENGKAAERGVRRSTDGADGPKQEHDADPSDGLSAKASVVSRAIRPCLRQGCRRPCVAHAQQTAIWRPSGGRSAGWRRSTGWCWATPRTSCAEARFAGVSHPPPLHAHSRGCRIGRCSLCHSVLWTTAAARGAGCSITCLQDCVKWCVAIGLLHDQREERSDDVPTGVVV